MDYVKSFPPNQWSASTMHCPLHQPGRIAAVAGCQQCRASTVNATWCKDCHQALFDSRSTCCTDSTRSMHTLRRPHGTYFVSYMLPHIYFLVDGKFLRTKGLFFKNPPNSVSPIALPIIPPTSPPAVFHDATSYLPTGTTAVRLRAATTTATERDVQAFAMHRPPAVSVKKAQTKRKEKKERFFGGIRGQ